MRLATKTLHAINDAMVADQGASFRDWQARVLPHIGDAYSSDTFPFRSHLGASIIGRPCSRELWYSFRWFKKPVFDSRLLRLFNRGHLEEGRFIAMLLMIGVEVYQQDENGKQYRISGCDGHYGGSGDGIGINIPDCMGEQVLLEFKTSADKYFKKLVKEGVLKSKWEHYVQMQTYMKKMNINKALYMCVNKNTDELHAEIIESDFGRTCQEYEEKAENIIFSTQPPKRLNESPGYWQCKFCDYTKICHFDHKEIEKNCRTCQNSVPISDGKWLCSTFNIELSKKDQYKGCEGHSPL